MRVLLPWAMRFSAHNLRRRAPFYNALKLRLFVDSIPSALTKPVSMLASANWGSILVTIVLTNASFSARARTGTLRNCALIAVIRYRGRQIGIVTAIQCTSAIIAHRFYSQRRATIGSTLEARRAGRYPASSVIARITPPAAAMVSGSCGESP